VISVDRTYRWELLRLLDRINSLGTWKEVGFIWKSVNGVGVSL
jgi:hypothetical protein